MSDNGLHLVPATRGHGSLSLVRAIIPLIQIGAKNGLVAFGAGTLTVEGINAIEVAFSEAGIEAIQRASPWFVMPGYPNFSFGDVVLDVAWKTGVGAVEITGMYFWRRRADQARAGGRPLQITDRHQTLEHE